MCPDSSVTATLGWTTGIQFPAWTGISLVFSASRQTLGPSKPVPAVVLLAVKRPEREVIPPPLYTSSERGVALSTGTSLILDDMDRACSTNG
jgi:hypothetical protein